LALPSAIDGTSVNNDDTNIDDYNNNNDDNDDNDDDDHARLLSTPSRDGLRERSKSGSDDTDAEAAIDELTREPSETPTTSAARPTEIVPMTTHEVALFGLYFAPLWFAANLTFNWSLALTSVSSTTIIASTSGLFTLMLGVALRLTQFHWLKLAGVLITIGGVVVVALSDRGSVRSETLQGDAVCLLSAIAYACYANVLKRRIDDDARISMAMFFGFVGLWNLVLFWPFFVLLHYTELEPFSLPDVRVLGFLTLNGLIGTVLSDWIWLQSMLLTSPLVSTLGLSVTIPVALLFDGMRGKTFSLIYLFGSLLVLIGFVMATVIEHRNAES
jgi:solute carrier family 35 protein F5